MPKPVRPLRYVVALLLLALASCAQSPQTPESPRADQNGQKKTALLLINHGSRSAAWKQQLLDLEHRIAPRAHAIAGIDTLMTAFMEHAEPSIASTLKTLDSEKFTDIIVIPLFLSTGVHIFDDIPTIIGQKENPATIEEMRLEGIERYIPTAQTHLAKPLDVSDLLAKNVIRRAETLSTDPSKEGLVLVGYGSEPFNKLWEESFAKTGTQACAEGNFAGYTTAWCGHVAHYSPDSTATAIKRILKKHDRAIVIPLLVSFSEKFQIDIIGRGVAMTAQQDSRVRYRPDSILPDPDLEAWIVKTAETMAEEINGNRE